MNAASGRLIGAGTELAASARASSVLVGIGFARATPPTADSASAMAIEIVIFVIWVSFLMPTLCTTRASSTWVLDRWDFAFKRSRSRLPIVQDVRLAELDHARASRATAAEEASVPLDAWAISGTCC
jgi:hypothetical protein